MNPNHEHACGCEHTHETENQYNKYEDALNKYQTNLKDDEIAEKTARLDYTEVYRQRHQRDEVHGEGQ